MADAMFYFTAALYLVAFLALFDAPEAVHG